MPVPLHRDRERERGYNQAGLVSKPLSRKLGLPHQAVLLMRTKPRPNKQILAWRNGGSPFVALLPHVRAAKLTISAFYW